VFRILQWTVDKKKERQKKQVNCIIASSLAFGTELEEIRESETYESTYYPNLICYSFLQPIPVAVRSKAWVCGHSLTGIVSSNPTGGMDVCLL
jgi:hypothetical protein